MIRRHALLASAALNLDGGIGPNGFNFDNYLTIEALDDGLRVSLDNDYEYCIDGSSNWTKIYYGEYTPEILKGQKISFRGTLLPTEYSGIGTFNITKLCNLEGNCMSMLFGDDAADHFNIQEFPYAFYRLFFGNDAIVSVSDNFLPATTLSKFCYETMFYNCTNLQKAPKLPAMTLEEYCYYSMFYGCSNLQVAPDLNAPILVYRCYYTMFRNCSKLNHVKALFTTKPSTYYTSNWLRDVSATGTFIKSASATWDVRGMDAVPYDWTIKTE